jgi:hypothetical protein
VAAASMRPSSSSTARQTAWPVPSSRRGRPAKASVRVATAGSSARRRARSRLPAAARADTSAVSGTPSRSSVSAMRGSGRAWKSTRRSGRRWSPGRPVRRRPDHEHRRLRLDRLRRRAAPGGRGGTRRGRAPSGSPRSGTARRSG